MDYIYPVIGKQQCFPFYLTGIGISEPEYHIVREKGLLSHQIMFTLKGAGKLLLEQEEYVLEEGSLFYIEPGVPHEYYPLEKDNWMNAWIVFRGENLHEIMPKLGFDRFYLKDNVLTENIRKIFEQIGTAAREPVYGNEKCSVLIYEYIMAIRQAIQSGDKYGTHRRTKSIIADALVYIHENYSQDITLEELAILCGVTKQHFCRVFKAEIGMRPLEYLARKRIAEARALLLNTNMPVAEIGRKVGYESPTYFGIVYKKYEGISPSDCRKRKGASLMW